MKILNYIHELKDNDLMSDCLRAVVAGLQTKAEVYVATRKDDVRKMLDEHHPDIIHIHGAWDYNAYKLMLSVQKQGYAVVLSPQFELGIYSMRHEQKLRKKVETIHYQKWMVQHAEALIAVSDEEKNELLALGWQKRIDVAQSSVLDNSVTLDTQCSLLLKIYAKVIDSRYRKLMSDSEKEAVSSLIHVGMAHDETMPLLDSERILTLRNLRPEQWRRILLFGDDEDIRGIISAGAQKMQIEIPSIDTSKIWRYPVEKPKVKGLLPDKKLNSGSRLSEKKINNTIDGDSEELRQITIMLVNARTLLRSGQMSVRHLADLYEVIKYLDYDEDRLVTITKELKMRKFLRRILQVLDDKVYLEEGFQPDGPVNDRTTRKIESRIFST